jgi:hypothetical protein
MTGDCLFAAALRTRFLFSLKKNYTPIFNKCFSFICGHFYRKRITRLHAALRELPGKTVMDSFVHYRSGSAAVHARSRADAI